VEAAAIGLPTVCIPRIEPRAEQLIRAKAFDKLGLLQVIHPNELDPESLRDKITLVLKVKTEELREHSRAVLRFDGASRAADLLISLATSRAPRKPVET
jgi:predicted glycosyltransferase